MTISKANATILWYLTILTSTGVFILAGWTDLPIPLKPLWVAWFMAFCPGLAWGVAFDFKEAALLVTFALGFSISAAVLTSLFILYADLWSPEAGNLILSAITLAGVAFKAINDWLRRSHAETTPDPTAN